jgi:iron complex transport system ATP-binding protein
VSALSLSGVHVEARGRSIISDISLEVGAKDFVALIGPNGAGKTTLLKVALGLVAATRGDVHLGQRDISSLSPRERAGLVAWLPQHTPQSEALSVLEVVVAARYRFGEARGRAEHAALRALERASASQYAARRITELSGGERQRVWLAALLAQEAGLLLLDEPANHLDPAQQLDTYRLLAELWAEGLALVLVTHDVNLLAELGAPEKVRVVGLRGGQMAFQSSYASAELPTHLAKLFGIDFDAVPHGEQRLLVPRVSSRRASPS